MFDIALFKKKIWTKLQQLSSASIMQSKSKYVVIWFPYITKYFDSEHKLTSNVSFHFLQYVSYHETQ